MVLEPGCRILVVHRRLFERDRSRYFLAIVEDYEHGIMKATGYTWLPDPDTTVLFRKTDQRTKIISVTSGAVIVYELPRTIDLDKVHFSSSADARLLFTDDDKLELDITEVEHLAQARPRAR